MTKPARVLVVDDHATNRLKLQMAVRALGHVAEAAENGVVALAKLREKPFDLVLLDIVMPEMTGHEVLDALRADATLRAVPVIVVSASEEMEDAVACIERGAEDCLPKPFDPVLLRARVGASLEKKRLNDAVRDQMALIRSILGKFVPETVVTEIIAQGGDLKPKRTVATVMMTDIDGFTALVEEMDPAEVQEMLNLYFKSLIEIITRHNGVLNDFIGDGAMVLFNVPLEEPEHADKAVRAALEIEAMTESVRFLGHRLRTRIGIDTGEVIAGNIGDGSRLTYTVFGDTVNTASRLEKLNAERGTRVTISDRTAAQLRGTYPIQAVGEITLRGKSAPIGVNVLEWSAQPM